ncbi:MAG TPA: hypothetical protein VFU07_07110 [Candidatus Lumbricidophila sp.]|nr:hypothetical protein [Candidatus Lumbricidophila sp.]
MPKKKHAARPQVREAAVAQPNPAGGVFSVPVEPAVQDAIDKWMIEHGEEFNTMLEPFGLGNYNIVRPNYRRVVLKGEFCDHVQ